MRREQSDEFTEIDKGGGEKKEMSSTRREVDVPHRFPIEG
jgi:hypothetical protein